MRTHISPRLIFVVTLLLSLSFVFSCQAAQGIKERMKDRLPAINSLKDSGVIGENNQGYLEFRKDNKKEAALVADENNDREKVYAAIAKQQGVTVELVGSRRALQIAEIASPGTWLQKKDGSWYQK